MGNSDQLHKVGDAFAHSYLNSKGTRMMYGSRLWLLPGLGWATLEHAFDGPDGHENADIINKRPVEYRLYVETLQKLYSDPNFIYNKEIKGKIPNVSIFNYVQKNGVTKENNIFLLNSFIELVSGTTEFKLLTKTQYKLLKGYLDQEGYQYDTHTKQSKRTDMDGRVILDIENNRIYNIKKK